jgi:Xaa-Pro dipeptidase
MNRKKFIAATGAATTAATILPSMHSLASAPSSFDAAIVKAMKQRIKPITAEERQQRQEKARKLMTENKIDAIFMEGGTSMNYFTGAQWGRSERLFGMVLPKNGEPFYISPAFEEGRAKEQTGNAKIYVWQENESPFELLKKVFGDAGLSGATIGMEETTRYFIVDNLQKAIPALKMVSATPVTAGCRAVKSAHEIELMQVANDITAEVYKAAVLKLKEGMGEKELGSILTSLFAEFGTDGGALVLFGEAAAYPHGTVKENYIKENSIILIDGGCTVEGYNSDITRTTVFGKPTEKMKTVWSIVSKAQDAALKTARPGIEAQRVDAAARKVIEDSGYGNGYKYFTHRLGHGIGLDGHEWNYLVGGSAKLLQTGNTFSNEPGIYIPGEFGIRIEDEMLITENGAKLLLPQQESLEKIF